MSFLYPLGFIALIGVVALIVIYIIMSKYIEQKVPSTYIWQLSKKFMKQKASKLRLWEIILFLLELLMIIILAFILTQPLLLIEGGAKEYVFILDCSASMTATTDGQSRFDRAVGEITAIAEEMPDGSNITVIQAGEKANVLVIRAESGAAITSAFEGIECGNRGADIKGAEALAREYATAYSELRLFTDTEYVNAEEGTFSNVSVGEENYSATALSYSYYSREIGGTTMEFLAFSGEVASYGSSDVLTVSLFVDGKETGAKKVRCVRGKTAAVTFDTLLEDFNSARLEVVMRDSLPDDNAFYITKNEVLPCTVLLASDAPFYLRTLLSVYPQIELTVTSTIGGVSAGYDLYIYDACAPASAPTDGASWYFAPPNNVLGSGFTVGSIISGGNLAQNKTPGETGGILLDGVDIGKVSVKGMTYIAPTPTTEVVALCGTNPAILAGRSAGGRKAVVFSFDLHDSNLPMIIDYFYLMSNLVRYSTPSVSIKDSFTIGDTAKLEMLPKATGRVEVDYPHGAKEFALVNAGQFNVECEEIGVYTVTQQLPEEKNAYRFAANFYLSESNLAATDTDGLFAEFPQSEESGGLEQKMQLWTFLAYAILAIMLAEWLLYIFFGN